MLKKLKIGDSITITAENIEELSEETSTTNPVDEDGEDTLYDINN